MKFNFHDIDMAFEFVSSAAEYANGAILDTETGKIYYRSDMLGEDEFPEDADEKKYVSIPHKNELDLGKNLVFDFVGSRIPDRLNEVDRIFSKRGAYSRFKLLLQRLGRLDEWHKFEDAESEKALREWCEDEGIELED